MTATTKNKTKREKRRPFASWLCAAERVALDDNDNVR